MAAALPERVGELQATGQIHISIGSSTWGQGDPQRDWVDPLYELDNDRPDLSGKKVAFFGAGDQKTHGEHFLSALGKMHDLFTSLGASAYGFTGTSGYEYEHSLAERDGKFCGLGIDDINQEDLTKSVSKSGQVNLKAKWACRVKIA